MPGSLRFPLFCTTDVSFGLTNGVLQASVKEAKEKSRTHHSWVYISSIDQSIFVIPTPPLESFESDFIDAEIRELGFFCKMRFGPSKTIYDELFGVIDARSAQDRTMLLARWEEYTSADDAILRFVWGDTTASDEESFLQHMEDSKQQQARLREQKRMTQDWVASVPEPYQVASKRESTNAKSDSLRRSASQRSTSQRSTSQRSQHSQRSRADTAKKASSARSASARRSPPMSSANEAAVLEGWRTVRVPIATVMRDISLVFDRSITDLLKHRSLFDKFGVLQR